MTRRDLLRTAAVAAGALATPLRSHAVAGSGTGTAPALDLAGFGAARRFVETPFGRIAVVERGVGPRAAIFLHGFPLSGFQWRGALERLSPFRRCLAPDFLALGETEVADGASVAPDAQAAMILALADRLRIDRFDLVASDSGGAVAQLLVARAPQRVRSLLLANCDSEIDCPPPALAPVIALAKEGKFVDQWLGPWLADPALARSAEGIGGMCYADPAHPTDEALASYFAPLVASSLRKDLVHRYALALEPNVLAGVEPALRRSTVPARIVWGTADAIFSPASPDYLARAFGDSRGVRRLEGAKLFWPEERPEVLAEEARALWETT